MRVLFNEAQATATVSITEARQSAERLAAVMQNIHGGTWTILIDHASELVLVARRYPVDIGDIGENHR